MPCRVDVYEPSEQQKQENRAGYLLAWLMKQRGYTIPTWLTSLVEGKCIVSNKAVPALCEIIKQLTETERNKYLYNARVKESRALADWWEEHEEADFMAQERDRLKKEQDKLKKRALAKLTLKERNALGY